MGKRWRFWFGVLISALFLYYALRGQQLPQVWSTLRQANYWWLIPGVAIYFVAVGVRTWRWYYMLRPIKEISLSRLFPIVTIGYMGNNIYPARAGEVLRAYVLKRQEGVSISASLATVVVERIFDGVSMLFFVFVTLPFASLGQAYEGPVMLFSALFFGALLVFFLLAVSPQRAQRVYALFVDRLLPLRLRPAAHHTLDRFMTGLASLRSGRDAFMIFLTSVVIWLLETGKYWFVMHAFPFSVNFYVLMLMTAIVNLATTLPSAPGYVGTFDAPGIQVLESFGVAGDLATGYTLVLHAALWLPITLLGAYFMTRESLSWKEVQASVQVEG
jgi:hypothetical protein